MVEHQAGDELPEATRAQRPGHQDGAHLGRLSALGLSRGVNEAAAAWGPSQVPLFPTSLGTPQDHGCVQVGMTPRSPAQACLCPVTVRGFREAALGAFSGPKLPSRL